MTALGDYDPKRKAAADVGMVGGQMEASKNREIFYDRFLDVWQASCARFGGKTRGIHLDHLDAAQIILSAFLTGVL